MSEEKKLLWRDRKRNFLGLPWTFTVYEMNEEFLRIQTGLINTKYDRVNLYRITDVTITVSLWQKIIKTGTLHIDSDDQTMRNFDIKNIKLPMQTEELLSELVEKARHHNRVYMREGIGGGEPHDFDGDGMPDDVDDDPDEFH